MTSVDSVGPILVTGGSGYLGSHVILQLLQQGYTVRTTVRSLSREAEVRQALEKVGAPSDAETRLTFFAADLEKEPGWVEAVQGCEYVHHIASPFPSHIPKNEDELIVPAREGTLRVLRAARDAGVRRVVLTASFASVGSGWGQRKEPFTEEDWSILDESQGFKVDPYPKSKTIAERAAWDFMKDEGGEMELAVVNPVLVLGPAFGKDTGTSLELIKKLIDGSVPGCPQVDMGLVDVRDVSDLHIRAMTNPKAKGERFLAVADEGVVSLIQMARIIKEKRPKEGKKAPTIQLPNFLVRFVALFDPKIRQVLPGLGMTMKISNDKAKRELGWAPRPVEETIVDTVDCLVKEGHV